MSGLIRILLLSLIVLVGSNEALQLAVAHVSVDLPDLRDRVIAIDLHNNDFNRQGCNRIKIHDVNSKMSILWSADVSIPAHLAATSDLSMIVGTVAGGKRHLFGFTSNARADGEWRSVFMSANLDYGAPAYITRDDQDMILPYVQGIGRLSLANMYRGVLGSSEWSMGVLPEPEKLIENIHPVAMTDSLDARVVFVAATNGNLYQIDRQSFQIVGDPLAFPVTATDISDMRMSTYMTISPDGRYLVINGGQRALLTIIDIQRWVVSTVRVEGLTTTWGMDFNYQVEGSILAVHGRNRVAVYRFNGTSPPSMLAIASIPAFNPGSPELRGAISAPDLIWSGRGDKVVAFSSALRSLALFDYLDGSPASLQASSGLVQCAPDTSNPEWIPLPAAMLSSNRAPYRPPPTPIPTDTARPTTSPTDTATPTDIPSATPSATATSSATSTATVTSSPTATTTPTPAPAYLPLLLRERCLPQQRRVDVVLVLDASLSMLEPAGGEAPPAAARSKLDAARDAARAFLDALRLAPGAGSDQGPGPAPGQGGAEGDQAAIVAFNSAATLLSPLSANRAALDAALGAIAPGPQTCIVCGVDAAAQELASARHRPGSAAVLVLLTDGRSNPQPPAQAVARAQAAKAAGVRVYTIGLGADLDEAALREMASGDDGYRHAPSAAELAGIYRGIAVDIPCPVGAFWAGR